MANNQKRALLEYIGGVMTTVLLLIFVSQAAFSLELSKTENPAGLYKEANRFYQKGDYQKAAEIYGQLIASGYENGNLYYNLGNTCYKLGQKGMAIFYYEKAKRLIPGDADLKANLAYVRDKTGESVKGPWNYELGQFLAYLATIDQMTVMSSVLFFILLGLLIYIVLFPHKIKNEGGGMKPFWWYGLLTVSAVFIITLSITILTIREHSVIKAVATSESANVLFEPNLAATLYYELKEGAVVNIVEEKDGWALIKRPDGKRGWVEKKNLAKI